ncbi:MAG: SRPBCC domain-containing protein [Anaerolineae bacterium]|nr:SRPBCC domain-containing protein [Anaerolineae bacterium]
MNAEKPVGLTKNQGWEIGVRRTLPLGEAKAWRMIMHALGLSSGEGPDEPNHEVGATFTTADDVHVEIRSCAPSSLIRMKWQPGNWQVSSTLQIRVLPAKKGSTIAVHHEGLQNAQQREAMRQHWTALLESLA